MNVTYMSVLSAVTVMLTFICTLPGCGGGGGSAGQVPSITITNPTSAPSYATVWTGELIGGTISNAGFVTASNAQTGASAIGLVIYNQGIGSWSADIRGLLPGDNLITVTADSDGTGTNIANAYINLIRPLQPINEIFNGLNPFSANTYWTDDHSFNQSHKIALFEDGTGRSTTGSALGENAGSVLDFTWTILGPESILITNCPSCSFQMLSRISGSITVNMYNGQIETVGGMSDLALHTFSLQAGTI